MSEVDVLIVDDEPCIRMTLSYLMKKSGYTVDTAKDGVEAINKVQQQTPKLMFLDIMMPRKDGYEVLSALKNNVNLNNTCVLMLSAKGQMADKQRALEMGADGFIAKPYKSSDLLDRASKICRVG